MNINNLTKIQMTLLDKLWVIQTKEELEVWMNSLDDETLIQVMMLRELLIYECIDESTKNLKSEDFTEANAVLAQFKL